MVESWKDCQQGCPDGFGCFFAVLVFHVGFKPLLALHSLDFELFLTQMGFIPALTHRTEFQSSRNSLAQRPLRECMKSPGTPCLPFLGFGKQLQEFAMARLTQALSKRSHPEPMDKSRNGSSCGLGSSVPGWWSGSGWKQ